MPLSLKTMLKKFAHKGQITQEEYDALIKKLEGHDKEIRNKAIDEFAERVKSYVDCGHLCNPTELRWSDLTIETMIDTIAEQLKEE